MKKSVLLASHLLALAAGWFAFQPAETPAAAATTAGPERERRDERQRAELAEGRRLLVEMERGWGIAKQFEKKPGAPPARTSTDIKKEIQDQWAVELEKVRKKSAAITLPADPAAELQKLLKGPNSADATALAIAWLREDPVAALRAIEGIPDLRGSSSLSHCLQLWAGEVDVTELAGLMKESPSLKEKIAAAAANAAAQSGFAEMGALIGMLEAEVSRDSLLRGVFTHLPAEHRDEALGWVRANLKGREAGKALLNAAGEIADPKEAWAFLKQAREDMDPEVLEALQNHGSFRRIIGNAVGPDSPLEDRVAAALASGVSGGTEQERVANARRGIVAEDLDKWFRENHWREALHFQAATVPEIWSAVEASFPAFAAGERDLMVRKVFMETAIQAPEAAMALLAEEGREGEAAKWVHDLLGSGMATDFQTTVRLVSLLPEDAVRADLQRYDHAYSQAVTRRAEEGGRFWTDWVRKQKPGLGRDLLLHHTAVQLMKQGQETESAELKALIADTEIKNRPLR